MFDERFLCIYLNSRLIFDNLKPYRAIKTAASLISLHHEIDGNECLFSLFFGLFDFMLNAIEIPANSVMYRLFVVVRFGLI